MRYAVTYTLSLLLALSAQAQVQPFTLHQTDGPTGGPTRTITTTHTADGARAVLYHPLSPEPGSLSPRTVTLPDEAKRFLITDELN
ncbi:MAG: hypothetical protein IPJ98_18510 [Bryobacterales bacterium]|nr:hypothetical protein [Bryobacterales bacterium]